MDDDFRIELFIFPDGTEVEMMVFDRSGHGSASPSSASPAPAPSSPPPAPAGIPQQQCAVDHAPEPAASVTATAAPDEVHVCPVCHGDLVHPVDWERTAESVWQLRLRCPECETVRNVVMGRSEVEQLNRELYHGAQALAREAERLRRRNFEDEARRFIAALRDDLIQPFDF